jgi:hypothetical protein
MFLLVDRTAFVANEVFISFWMLVRSVLEPQNPVCIVDRKIEFCMWVIDLCLGEDECHCMWGVISFWRFYFQNQTMYIEFLTLQVNILGFWLIAISKTAAMNTLIWAAPTDHNCFAVACEVWTQDLISMLFTHAHSSSTIVLWKTNKNTIQPYHQRNGQIWVHEFLGIVNMVCRHIHVYSLSDTWEFVINISITVVGIAFTTYVITTSRVTVTN